MPVIKVTLASGHEHQFPFDIGSTLTVESNINDGPSATKREQRSWGEVTGIELVDGVLAESPSSPDESPTPMLTSPAVAIQHAKGLAVADAGAHIEQALAKFPDDPDLLQVQGELDHAVRTAAETWTTDVEGTPAPDPEEPAVEEPGTETPGDVVSPELDTPEAAVAHLDTGLTLEQATEHVAAALEKWPEDADLLAAKAELDELQPPAEPEQT